MTGQKDTYHITSDNRHMVKLTLPLVAILCVSALLITHRVAAQESGSHQSVMCGQSRSVLVRFLDGRPAPGVNLTLSAASPDMGGPELYTTDGLTGRSATEGRQDVAVSPLMTPDARCTPVITGTLTATTDRRGLGRFEHLGEGLWILQFKGVVNRAGRTMPIVPVSVQGLFPQGRNRAGGGFIEQVTSLNEEGGPNEQGVQPGVGVTTSRYLLEFSIAQGGWLPGIDLATDEASSGQYAVPIPLAQVAPAATVLPDGPVTLDAAELPVAAVTPAMQGMSQTSRDHRGIGSDPQESVFDSSSAEVATGTSRLALQPAGQNRSMSHIAWWEGLRYALLLGLLVGGIAAIAWARRRAHERSITAGSDEQKHAVSRARQ